MTLDDIRKLDREMLIPADVAPLLGTKPYSINLQAHDDPSRLGFSVVITGRRVRIPRRRFIAWMEGGDPNVVAQNATDQ